MRPMVGNRLTVSYTANPLVTVIADDQRLYQVRHKAGSFVPARLGASTVLVASGNQALQSSHWVLPSCCPVAGCPPGACKRLQVHAKGGSLQGLMLLSSSQCCCDTKTLHTVVL
jgi:hypothetical protein